MSPPSLIVPNRRLFLRNSGTAVLSGAAVALLAHREALAQSDTMPRANLHDSAPTQFQEMGDARLAYRRDIIAFAHALGAKQVDIFGFSIGGMVAQQIALDAPELVRRLILAGTGPKADSLKAAVRRCY